MPRGIRLGNRGCGGLRAVGVGGGATGPGGDLIVIDDPIKSREEADSLTYRDRLWDWFRDDLYTRQEPGAPRSKHQAASRSPTSTRSPPRASI